MKELRNLYNVAHLNAKNCQALTAYASANPSIIANGYLAASQMIAAKFIFNPLTKIKLFTEGKNSLEEIISKNPREYELFYIRYTIQKNTPGFLGYHKNLKTDKLILINFMNESKDEDLKKHILYYLTNTNDVWTELKRN